MSIEKIINEAWKNKDQVNQNSDKNNKGFALATSALHVSSVQDSLDFLSHERIAKIQQMFSILSS